MDTFTNNAPPTETQHANTPNRATIAQIIGMAEPAGGQPQRNADRATVNNPPSSQFTRYHQCRALGPRRRVAHDCRLRHRNLWGCFRQLHFQCLTYDRILRLGSRRHDLAPGVTLNAPKCQRTSWNKLCTNSRIRAWAKCSELSRRNSIASWRRRRPRAQWRREISAEETCARDACDGNGRSPDATCTFACHRRARWETRRGPPPLPHKKPAHRLQPAIKHRDACPRRTGAAQGT